MGVSFELPLKRGFAIDFHDNRDKDERNVLVLFSGWEKVERYLCRL